MVFDLQATNKIGGVIAILQLSMGEGGGGRQVGGEREGAQWGGKISSSAEYAKSHRI